MLKYFLSLFLIVGFSWGIGFLDGGSAAQVNFDNCSFSAVEFSFSCGELTAEPIQTDNGDFARLNMLGTSPSEQIGAAEIPVIRTIVEIPQGTVPTIEVLPDEIDTFFLDDFDLPELIYPRQAPVPKIPDYQPKFVIDEDFYSSDNPQFSSDAEIIDISQARDHRIALVEIHPINYIPSKGEIFVIRSGKIFIHTPGANIAATRREKEQHRSKIFDSIIEPLVINSSFYRSLWVVPTDIEMIIVTDASFTSQLADFEHWKKRKGYKIDVKTASELGSSASGIKSYIQGQYDSGDVDFVLLVGDVGSIPAFTGGSSGSSSDNPYSELAGSDYIPDCFVGRMSLTSTSQVTEFAGRTVTYEHFGFGTGTNWTKGACLPASDDASYHTFAENTQRYVANTHFGPYGYTRIDTIWAYYGGTGSDVISSINAGVMIANYTGHGYNAGWAGPSVGQDDVRNLTNQGKYPMVISNACQTGMFGEYSECFMETWIRQTDKGAIASLGASDYTYWDEDDEMERRMIDSVFVAEWMFTGGMRLKGLMGVYHSYSSSAEYYFDMYNLFGDPSVALWWGAPQSLTASYPGIISPGDGSVAMNITSGGSPVNEALVCITNDDDIQEAGYTDASGNVTLFYTGATVGDTLWLTATAYNKIPYEGYIVISGSGPFLLYESHTIQDDGGYGSSGDGDNIADAGETIALWVTLRNSGSENALGVSAIASESSPYANITDNSSGFETILAGATDIASDPFVAQIVGTPPDETNINFSLTITDVNDSTWDDDFTITVRAPIMSMFSSDFTEIGDGDGFCEPGEHADLSITIHNGGGDDAKSVSGSIAESDAYISIVTGSSSFGDIAPSGNGSNSPQYRISISPSCPTPHIAHIYHTATDSRGYTCVDTISLLIGSGGFFDDGESGISQWSVSSPWHITDYRYNSPGHCFYAGDESWGNPFEYHDTTNAALTTANPIMLPADPRLVFWHFYETENGYDSCFVEVSNDGGSGWNRILAFSGPSFGWRFASADLSSFGGVGDQILLRFRFYADAGVRDHGWFIDDISVLSAENAYVGAGDVFPRAGNSGETFTFKITYASPDGILPTSATVYIDGTPHTITNSEGGVTTGKTFSYSTSLGDGTHSYHFIVQSGADEYRFPETGEISGPVVGSPLYTFDLGISDGGFTTQSFSYYQDWEWGAPSYGPSSVPYGSSCWGTRLNTTYHDSSQSRLKSPSMSIPDDGGRHYLVIWHWYRAQASASPLKHDGGNVRISVDGGDSFILFPQGGYDGISSRYNQLTQYLPIFGDTMNDFWQEEAFDVTPWAGHSIEAIFDFGSSSQNVEAGWYINRVSLFSAVAADIQESQKTTLPDKFDIKISPNPFNSSVKITISDGRGLARQTLTDIAIYDLRGNVVYSDMVGARSPRPMQKGAETVLSLQNGTRTFIWRPDKSISSGIYFVRAKIDGQTITKRVVYLK